MFYISPYPIPRSPWHWPPRCYERHQQPRRFKWILWGQVEVGSSSDDRDDADFNCESSSDDPDLGGHAGAFDCEDPEIEQQVTAEVHL